ncbi:hypothetical protein F5877DRAFT_66150 [Lentinula edodes]|nr:hypothetical protein F5877DRAFT_66150 [Lentinula edodes]
MSNSGVASKQENLLIQCPTRFDDKSWIEIQTARLYASVSAGTLMAISWPLKDPRRAVLWSTPKLTLLVKVVSKSNLYLFNFFRSTLLCDSEHLPNCPFISICCSRYSKMHFTLASAYVLLGLFTLCGSYPTGTNSLAKASPSPTGTNPAPSIHEDKRPAQEFIMAGISSIGVNRQSFHAEPQRNAQNVTITFIMKRNQPDLNDAERIEAAAYAKMSVLLLLDAASSELGLSGVPYNVRFTENTPFPCSKADAEAKGFSLNIAGIPTFQDAVGQAPMGCVAVAAKSQGTAVIERITPELREFYTGQLIPHQESLFWTRMRQFADYLKDWDP